MKESSFLTGGEGGLQWALFGFLLLCHICPISLVEICWFLEKEDCSSLFSMIKYVLPVFLFFMISWLFQLSFFESVEGSEQLDAFCLFCCHLV